MLFVLLLVAAPNPASMTAPRRAFVECLHNFEQKAIGDKMAVDAYAPAVKAACPSEAAALSAAMIGYDVGMGTKRATAADNAAADIADYRATSEERFRDATAPR